MSSIRVALAWSLVERYALIMLGLISYVVIARLLTPAEIGLYSVTAALVGIAQVIRDFGIGNYLIQERDLSRDRLETAYGFALAAGVVMCVVANVTAPWVASFYGDAQLATVLRATSLNFVVLPFCSISLGMLRRLMRFDRLLVANLLGGFIGFAVTVGLAIMDTGPVSLAWGTVSCNIATALCAWATLPAQARPRRPRLTQWRTIVAYGRQSTLAGVVVTAAMDVNDLVVGKVLGFAPVAMLNRAMGMMYLFHRDLLGAARNVAFPAFAAAVRDGKPLEPMFVYTFACVTAVGWTFNGFLLLFPLETLRLLAGAQWDAAVPLVMVFGAAGMVLCLAPLTQTVIMAAGRVDLASRADIVTSLLRVVVVSVTAVITRDLFAVAIAFFASFAISVPVFMAFKHRAVRTDWPALASQLARSLAVSIGTLFAPALVSVHAGVERLNPMPMLQFGLTVAATVVTWLFMLHLCGHPMANDPIYRALVAKVGIRSRGARPS
ncbi:MAG: oligosaccharide flippase family protein [Rubrivivax sp.]